MIRPLLVLLLLCSNASAGPSLLEQVAPTATEAEAQQRVAGEALARAKAIGQGALLIQNALGDERARSKRLAVCSEPEVTSLVARMRAFGAAWRDAVQLARVEVARAQDMAARAGRSAVELVELVDQETRRAAEADAWHRRYIESAFEECGPELEPTAGIDVPGVTAGGEARLGVAVIGLGGGSICPDYLPADGRVVVLTGREACVSRSACACEPEPVSPGAVLSAGAGDGARRGHRGQPGP